MIASLAALALVAAQDPWVEYAGGDGPGRGKHVVLVAGDEEYRSEQALPMLARILAVRHGFRCTVLFSIDRETGVIAPDEQTWIPGLEQLANADLMVIATRFRELPDEQMRHIVAFVEAGKPILGIRTATHAFAYTRKRDSEFARYDWRSEQWPGGFGRQVLGETWVAHHGHHGRESTCGVLVDDERDHPILRGVGDLWGPTDVYTVRDLDDARVLVRGQVLAGMTPDAEPVAGRKNEPMMPLVWVREYDGGAGRQGLAVCSTIGAATDFESEGLRRLFVNACHWLTGLADAIPAAADVRYVGGYEPSPFGFGKFVPGVVPSSLRLDAAPATRR